MSILVIGSTNLDISAHVDHLPQIGETLLGKSMEEEYGGKGANQACAIGKLGGNVTFLTCVGNDSAGHEILAYLENHHVDVSKVKISDKHKTGTALIQVDENGKNTIVVIQGANLACDKQYIQENEACFKHCDYVVVQLEIPLEAVESAILLAAKYKKKILLNPAPANNALKKSLYPLITYFTPNETELLTMANKKDMDSSIQYLLSTGIQHVIVTLGEQGSMLYQKNMEPVHVPARKVMAIDTVGAGDCFNGAFVVALDHGKDIKEAMHFASYAASIAVTKKGAQKAMPSYGELEK